MHVPYDDILARIAEPPLWWSEGVPRYTEFQPSMIDVYAGAALLVQARCQSCRRLFLIGVAGGVPNLISEAGDAIGPWSGDPPFHYNDPLGEDDCTGNSMTFVWEEILQAWWRAPLRVRTRTKDGEEWVFRPLGAWMRLSHLEGRRTGSSWRPLSTPS